MINYTHIVEVLNIIEAIFSKSLSIGKKYNKLVESIDANKKESVESLNLYAAFVENNDSLIKACSKIGFHFRVTNAENIKTDLLNLKTLLNQLRDNSKDVSISQPSSKTLANNYKLFFKDSPAPFTPQLMVNLQEEAEHDIDYLIKLLESGIKIFRVNCAFGNQLRWKKISDNFEKAKSHSNKKGQLLFDLSGNKIRIKQLPNKEGQHLQLNSRLVLTNSSFSASNLTQSVKDLYTITSTWAGSFSSCSKGEIIRFDDSKVIAQIEESNKDYVIARVKSITGDYSQLSIGKGINMPESNLPSSGLNHKDKKDLPFIINHGDIVSFSFTKSVQDIENYYQEIKKFTKLLPPVVIKIETCKAVENLHEILLACMRFPKVAVLVARGDLVSECGWKNLAEIQEKIYKYTRAAHLPNIIATEVLEQFNSTGLPLRSEIIDLHHAKKFDCILLNKGTYIFQLINFIKN